MSLVNTFRVVLNHCFETRLPLLEDRSYWVDFSQPYLYQQLAAAGGESPNVAQAVEGAKSDPPAGLSSPAAHRDPAPLPGDRPSEDPDIRSGTKPH
jgi:hypothetical protein